MKILIIQATSESRFTPKLDILILEDDNRIIRCIGVSISFDEIQDLRYPVLFDIDSFIKNKIKDFEGEELTPEEALIQHPSIKKDIIHLLRDKKLDDLIEYF